MGSPDFGAFLPRDARTFNLLPTNGFSIKPLEVKSFQQGSRLRNQVGVGYQTLAPPTAARIPHVQNGIPKRDRHHGKPKSGRRSPGLTPTRLKPVKTQGGGLRGG